MSKVNSEFWASSRGQTAAARRNPVRTGFDPSIAPF